MTHFYRYGIYKHRSKKITSDVFDGALIFTIFFLVGFLIGYLSVKPIMDGKVEEVIKSYQIISIDSYQDGDSEPRYIFGYSGEASWYDYDLDRQDQKCRSNDCYSIFHATAASREIERGSYAKVTNLSNGKFIIVRINDYGPEEDTGRVIDLSSYAFSQIASLKHGVIDVKIEPLQELSTTIN